MAESLKIRRTVKTPNKAEGFGGVLSIAKVGSWKLEIDEGKKYRLYADTIMMRLLGLAEDVKLSPEALYDAWFDRVDPASRGAIAEVLKSAKGGQPVEVQYSWRHSNGRTLAVRSSGAQDPSYKQGLRVVGIVQLVAAGAGNVNRSPEDHLRQLKESLEFTNYFVGMFFSTYAVNLDTRAYKVYRRTEAEDHDFPVLPDYLQSLNEYIAKRVHPNDREEMGKFVQPENLKKMLRTSVSASHTFRVVADKDEKICRLYVIQGRDESNVAFGFADITGQATKERQMQSERQRQIDENLATERANKAKSYFFSTVSHDIRTPLNAIIGYAELLKLGIADEAERAVAIDSLLVSGHALLELINDVLDLSKLEAGKMKICPEPVDVMRLVDEVAKTFRVSIGNKSVEILTDVTPMPWLKLDPHRVRQILFNLVGNAVKFTEQGYIKIRAAYGDGMFRFAVSDTGCGISEEDQRRIAQPYVQFGDASSRGKGTGLGLAICRQLVAKMGGDIELQSVLGKGTTFSVSLPSVAEGENERQARLSTTQRIRLAVQSKVVSYKSVLIVDDQPMNRAVLKVMLSRFGIGRIITAENGKDALVKLEADKDIDLVLTDMWMPEMDGEALVREIRRNAKWSRVPVYAITADVEAQKDYHAMGFAGILLKPITLMKLKELLG